jgi:hypothetical protein
MHYMNALNALPASLPAAKDLLLARAEAQGVSLAGWILGQCKIFLGSLGIDWKSDANKAVFLGLVRSGALSFARADMVAAMDPAMVAASEVTDGVSSWHFLVLSA